MKLTNPSLSQEMDALSKAQVDAIMAEDASVLDSLASFTQFDTDSEIAPPQNISRGKVLPEPMEEDRVNDMATVSRSNVSRGNDMATVSRSNVSRGKVLQNPSQFRGKVLRIGKEDSEDENEEVEGDAKDDENEEVGEHDKPTGDD